MIWQTKPTLLALSLVLLSGCAGTLNPQQREQAPSDIAATWQHGLAQNTLAVDQQWLQTLENPYIEDLVNKALNNNQALLQSAYDVQIQKQQLIISGSALWPDLDLSAQTRRSKDNRPVSYDNASSVTLELSYEVDVWGKLSDAKRQANLNYLAQQAWWPMLSPAGLI